MQAAKLLIIAYRTVKRGEPEIAQDIFLKAMEDDSAPALMEDIHALEQAAEELEDLEEGEEFDLPDENEAEKEEDLDDVEEEPELTDEAKARLRAIANRIDATDGGANSDLAERLRSLL